MKKIFTLFCGILMAVALVATASTQVVKIWHEGKAGVVQTLSKITSMSFGEKDGSYYYNMAGEDEESQGGSIYVGDSLTFASVDVYSSRPEDYSKKISDNVYQSASNTDMYVVLGSADNMWHEMVDLGVKDTEGKSVLFATTNLGAESTTEYGNYYSFDDAQAAPSTAWGSEFSVPTQAELVALANNSTNSYANGALTFTSKTNDKASIVLPAAGMNRDNRVLGEGLEGSYWTCAAMDYLSGYCLTFFVGEDLNLPDYNIDLRTTGKSVRPVVAVNLSGESGDQPAGMPSGYTKKISDNVYQSASNYAMYVVKGSADSKWHEMVDLGVKDSDGKSVLFATMNLGAEKVTEYGGHYTFEDAKTQVTSTWGSEFSVPTKTQLSALVTNTTSSFANEGMTFTSKTNTKASIFLPAAGWQADSGSDYKNVGSQGHYWSNTEYTGIESFGCNLTFESNGDVIDYDGTNKNSYLSVRPVAAVDLSSAAGGESGSEEAKAPEGYTTKIADGVYQNESNTAKYVVKGSVDGKWHEMVDLGVKDTEGKSVLFATMNLGAEKVTDYGEYYTYADAQKAVTSTWGTEFSVPTKDEFASLINNCYYSFADKGMTFTNDKASIFLPAAGCKTAIGTKYDVDRRGYYWASTIDLSSDGDPICLLCTEGHADAEFTLPATEYLSVRPVAAVSIPSFK